MISQNLLKNVPNRELGRLLRHWRDVRNKSQMEISLDTGISQRHVSFIECGRSTPGRQTLLNIARSLDVPFRDQNELLIAAGFAPVYDENVGWNAVEMRAITGALERMLRKHEPFPAVVMDRYWNVLMRNAAAPRFFGAFFDLENYPGPRNMLHMMFDPAAMRPFVRNWEEASRSLIQRLHRETVGRTLDDHTRALLASLLAYPDVSPSLQIADVNNLKPTFPIVPLTFQKDGHVMSYFSMIATVGTPETITTQELRIESMFPADEATEESHQRFMMESQAR